jgi:hypothetical protein
MDTSGDSGGDGADEPDIDDEDAAEHDHADSSTRKDIRSIYWRWGIWMAYAEHRRKRMPLETLEDAVTVGESLLKEAQGLYETEEFDRE